jgi:hypothetical protein
MAYGLKDWVCIETLATELTPGGDCCMVEVRTSLGTELLSAEAAEAGLATGVRGSCGLCSDLTVVKEGLQAGVWGDGAVKETCEAVDVE